MDNTNSTPETPETPIPDGQNISSERQEPTHYAMIPKMATMDLNPYELAFYVLLKQTASDHGVCFKTNATLARESGMSVSRLKEARKSLEEKGFIRVTYTRDENGIINTAPDVVIVDIWAENHRRYATTPSRQKTTPRSRGDHPQSPENTKEKPSKKNPKKKVSGDTHSHERDFIFEAVAAICFDLHSSDEINGAGGRVAKISNWVKQTYPGATPKTITAFGVHYDTNNPGASRPRDLDKFKEHFVKFHSYSLERQKLASKPQPFNIFALTEPDGSTTNGR